MSYTKQTWNTGDVITAQKLNHMEDGIANCGLFVVTITNDDGNYSCDKTNEEIYNAWLSGANVVAIGDGIVYTVNVVVETDATFFNFTVLEHDFIIDCYEIYTESDVQTVTSTTYSSNNT